MSPLALSTAASMPHATFDSIMCIAAHAAAALTPPSPAGSTLALPALLPRPHHCPDRRTRCELCMAGNPS